MSFSLSDTFSIARARALDYVELTKPRPISLVIMSTAVGYVLAAEAIRWTLFGVTLLGTAMVAAGAMTLNQWLEKDEDGSMTRTLNRPLPAKRLHPAEALFFGVFLSGSGLCLLAVAVNGVSTFLAALTLFFYLGIYTPMKKTTPLNTLIGAIPGAIPPLIGWSAETETLSFGAWTLFAIIFLWQIPHFYAISWMCRNDYAAAGFVMLSVINPDGAEIRKQILWFSILLFAVSFLPTVAGVTGLFYLVSALVLGIELLRVSFDSVRDLDHKSKALFRYSVAYLFLLFIIMMVDKV